MDGTPTQQSYEGFEETPDEDKVAVLNHLIEQLVDAEVTENDLEEKLKAAKKVAQDLRENAIPNQLISMGLKEVATENGVRVTLKQDVRGSFFVKNPEKREPAFKWLEAHGYDGIVKNVVSVNFDREQAEIAKKFYDYAREFGEIDVQQKRDINNKTLMAFLREQIRENQMPPLELFGAMQYSTVKVDIKGKK